jgi:pimeloyl-ACP methyl ester carboxylesterase
MVPEPIDRDIDGVVLLHGIARRARSLNKMERALRADGYITLNLDYSDREQDLKGIAERLQDWVAEFARGLEGRLHFVTHSMGGLVVRALITQKRPPNLGRIVALAPPNGGSEVADLLRDNKLYVRFFGPAGAELTTKRSDELRALLGVVDYPLGVIAGDRTIDPIASFLILPRPNDGRVSVAQTRVDGMADHIVLPASHALMMNNPSVIMQTLYFLHHGRFQRPVETPNHIAKTL